MQDSATATDRLPTRRSLSCSLSERERVGVRENASRNGASSFVPTILSKQGFLLVLLLTVLISFQSHATDLILCGAKAITIIDPKKPKQVKWSWTAKDSPSIPPDLRWTFRSTDECKPYEGGLILVTSSSQGVALIERKTKRTQFLALSKNAHSACLLPRNQIAVAASFSGDEVQFFSRNSKAMPAKPKQRIELYGAHGSVWDSARNCLWALGQDEILKLKQDTNPRGNFAWSVEARHQLPKPGGHDLSPLHDGVHLYATASFQVFLFNRDKGQFRVHPKIGAEAKVKSVDRHPKTGLVVYHKGTLKTWWSDMIRFIDAEPIRMEGHRLYKVRWDIPIKQP